MHAVGDTDANYDNKLVVRVILCSELRAVIKHYICGSLLMLVADNLRLQLSIDEDGYPAT